MKELPHGNWTNMFLMYQAYSRAAGETPASRSTFFSAISQWKVCIKFHRRTHHQMRLTCSTLRSQIQSTNDSSHTISSSFWFPCQPMFHKNDFQTMSLMTINFVRTLGCLQPYPTGCLGTTRRCGKTGRHLTKPVKGPRANMTYWWWSWTRLISVNLSYPDGGSGVRPSGHYMRPPIVSQLSSPYFFLCGWLHWSITQWPCFNHNILDPVDKNLGTSLTLTGTSVHGYGVFIFVGDEGMPTGANWTIEVATCFYGTYDYKTSAEHDPTFPKLCPSSPAGYAVHWSSLAPGTSSWPSFSVWVSNLAVVKPQNQIVPNHPKLCIPVTLT